MSTPRPTVAAQLVAAMIETTPDRVRRRLDQAPTAAAGWTWQATAEAWAVDTGGETVILPLGHVAVAESVRCTCLLSPRCFHVLACLTSLEVQVVATEAAIAATAEPDVADEDDVVPPGNTQRACARDLVAAVAQVLTIGAANAGVVVQSGLLRAVHQCRAEGLHRLAAIGLRVLTGITELRARARSSDPSQLADDVAAILECARHVVHEAAVESYWIGTARRAQRPVRPRTLHGLFAEPIMTRTGYAGAAAYFLGEDDHIYSASDVRPGDAQLARDAYHGGIEIGPLVQSAKQLARGRYLGADMTASRDGRLGRGKGVRIVEQGASTWDADAVRKRFERPFAEQCAAAYALATLPDDAQPAGWDFVFLTGTVLGAVGPDLVFEIPGRRVRLAIANEHPALVFRENLRMLSHAPGLGLHVIGRLNLMEPGVVSALAIAPVAEASPGDRPQLDVPSPLAGRICLGFDEIQSPQILRRQTSPVILGEVMHAATAGPLDAIRRRWIATMLSGFASQRLRNTTTLAAEMGTLSRGGFSTGASLLDALSRAPTTSDPPSIDTFLATAMYLRSCNFELARASLEA